MKKLLSLLSTVFLVGSMLWAQQPQGAKTITISDSSIHYWVGSGTNQAILILGWDDDNTALAWGYRWSSGTPYVIDLLNAIDSADSRLSFSYTSGLVSGFTYQDSTYNLQPSTDWWCYYVNGNWAAAVSGQTVSNGDVFEFSDACSWSCTTAIGVSAPAGTPDTTHTVVDASIDSAAILYWVGSGEHAVIMAVNWNAPDTALAWGVRFSGDSLTLQTVMELIDSADSRFFFEPGSWGIDDIHFVTDNGDTLGLSIAASGYNYWWTNLNGTAAAYGYDMLYLHHGDLAKWGDPECGIALAYDYGYPSEIAWTTAITPVPAPYVAGPYDGAVGTDGCQAISATSTDIKAWATTCTIERGYQDIATATTRVTYGSESDATGAVTNTNNMGVVSLGDGGSATLTFNGYITNGEGYDFCVFENAFNDSFLELAFVEVSSDGEHFVRFPAVSLTQTSVQTGPTGSTDPTHIHNLAGKYRSLYGTPFDLEELRGEPNLDIDHVTHVRIVDVVGSIDPDYGTTDSQGNLVNDPYPTDTYSGGFDLDGIGVIHYLSNQSITTPQPTFSLYPNPATNAVVISNATTGSQALIYDMTGRLVLQQTLNGETLINLTSLQPGIYMIKVDGLTQRLIIQR